MILVDEHEPDNIVKLIRQSVPNTVVSPLNRTHRSDYFFGNYEGKTFQFSRKQAAELVGNIDEAEDQLADYYPNADFNLQIVEGWISPLPIRVKDKKGNIHNIGISDHSAGGLGGSARELGNKLFTYAIQPDGHIERGHSFSTIHQSVLYAWEHRLWMAGIPTIYTINWVETARRLVIIYRNEQKPPEEHQTLQRVIKPKTIVRNEAKMSDEEKATYRLQKSLMFLSDAYKLGIGEKKAKTLADTYVNLMDLAMADVSEISQCEGIGVIIAKKLLIALGRTL